MLETTGVVAPSVEKYSLQYIRPYHREIARRLVLGQIQADIARDLDINQGRLSIIVNSQCMKNEVARLEAMRDSGVEDVTTQLQELSPVALETVERIMIYGSKESIRLDAAKDILDRAGHAKVTKIDGTVVHETHEQRLGRLMGVRPEHVYMTEEKFEPTTINVTPTDAHDVSSSDNKTVDVGKDRDG